MHCKINKGLLVKKLIILFISFFIFSLQAEEGKIKKYVSLRAGPSWPHLTRLKVINSAYPQKIPRKSDTDLTLLYGCAFGISYEEKKLPFFFEVEYIGHTKATFFVKTKLDLSTPIFFINKFTIENQGVFGNAYYKIKIHDRLSPYINIGFGFSYNNVHVNQKAFGFDLEHNFKSREYKFCWNMGAGLISRIYKNLFGEIGYRYSDLNKIDSGKGFSFDPLENFKARLVRNEVIVSMRYEF
jgi:hypothetical protein